MNTQQQQVQLQQAQLQQQQQAPFYVGTTVETENLKKFLATAPQLWTKADDPPIRSYQLSASSGDTISCIFWKGKFFITGTDIVKILLFRFAQAGRPVLNAKKFEEGIFSDLRNLKAGTEAVLEEPKSEFLEFLFRHGCIRTQKKQKVFFWNCVPHESLFLDAIERDFKREGSLYHMNMMMNHTRYLQKQVAMMQASAIQQQLNSVGMAPPAPQMMPNTSRSSSFSGPSNPSNPQTSSFMYAAAAQNGNVADPFLNAPLRLPSGKINLNAPTPIRTQIPRLSISNNDPILQQQNLQQQQQQTSSPSLFDYQNDYDSMDGNLLSDYLDGSSSSAAFIDPSTIMNLHEY